MTLIEENKHLNCDTLKYLPIIRFVAKKSKTNYKEMERKNILIYFIKQITYKLQDYRHVLDICSHFEILFCKANNNIKNTN